MVRQSWIALSLSVVSVAMTGYASSVHEVGTRMLKHRKIGRSGLHYKPLTTLELDQRAYKKYKLTDNYAGANFFEYVP